MGANFVKEKIRQVRKAIPLRYRLAMKEIFRPLEGVIAFKKSDKRVKQAVQRLALGFHQQPLRDLEVLARGIGVLRRRRALIELMKFHGSSGTSFGRTEIVRLNWEFPAAQRLGPDEAIARSNALRIVGQHDVAKEVLGRVKTRNASDGGLLLARIGLEGSIDKKLELLAGFFSRQKLARFTVQANSDAVPFLNALALQKFEVKKRENGPKVSVLIATHNNSATLDTALQAILSQSWTNLECIVVDRASSDKTVSKLQCLAHQDSRVKLLLLKNDPGHYSALNNALAICTGSLITTHSATGWSHPCRIEHQVTILENPTIIASMVNAIEISGRGEISLKTSKFSFSDPSSLMFRTEQFCSEFGRWDDVVQGADAELALRIRARFGPKSIRATETVFCLNTEQTPIGFHTADIANYLALASAHHASTATLNYAATSGRSFAAPKSLVKEQGATATSEYDVIIASDFRMHGGSTLSSVEEVKAQSRAGLRTAIVQLNRYDINPEKGFNPKIVALLNQGAADLLSSTDKVSCDLLLVRYPPVLQHHQKCVPTVKPARVKVIVNQPPMSDYSENSVVRYTIPECLENSIRYFGTPGKWYPIGPLVRDALYKHHMEWISSFDLSPDDWPNIVDLDEFRPSRERKISTPVIIGRHSRDHIMKWPGTAKTLLMIYPDRNDIRVSVLGGAKTPTSLIGYKPKGWTVYEFDSLLPSEFLKNIDIFVYYTHDAWVESFGRVIIEAMAAALPTVLPPIYRPLFGEGAIYAEPQDVSGVIHRLTNDPQYYQDSSVKALSYVQQKFGHTMHVKRICENQLPRIRNAAAQP